MGPKMQTLENLVKKRINAVIAILKDIEKNKVNPTLGILESLMEAADPKNNYENRIRDYEEDNTHPDFYNYFTNQNFSSISFKTSWISPSLLLLKEQALKLPGAHKPQGYL